jgi:hypothetical protein
MDKERLYEIRKANVALILSDRFFNHKANMAKAAGLHRNTISLLLTGNEDCGRNLGELLARKMERGLLLPSGWLDSPHDTLETSSAYTIKAVDIDARLRDVLRTCEIPCYCVPDGWTDALPHLTARENLYIATLVTDDVSPDMRPGSWVMVDGEAKAWNGPGYYLLSRDKSTFLRHITRKVSGEFWVSGGPKASRDGETLATLKGLKVLGRVVAQMPQAVLVR